MLGALILLGGLLLIGATFFLGAGLGFGAGLWTLTALIDVLLGFFTFGMAFEAAISHDNGGCSRLTPLAALGALVALGGIVSGIVLGGSLGWGLGLAGAGVGLWLSIVGLLKGQPD